MFEAGAGVQGWQGLRPSCWRAILTAAYQSAAFSGIGSQRKTAKNCDSYPAMPSAGAGRPNAWWLNHNLPRRRGQRLKSMIC